MEAGLSGHAVTRVSRLDVGLLLGLCGAPTLCAAQLFQAIVVRADLAALDPSYSQGIHLAWSAGAGLQVTPHSDVLFDVSRQNLAEELGGESTFWQTYVGGSWEHAFGAPALYRRQVMVTARGGVLIRPAPYDDAPYLGVGIGLRYPVASWLHFQARLEDDLDLPKGQTVQSCIAPGYCSPLRVGGHLEHNLGLFLGAEIHQ
jgi:hypothetical protein